MAYVVIPPELMPDVEETVLLPSRPGHRWGIPADGKNESDGPFFVYETQPGQVTVVEGEDTLPIMLIATVETREEMIASLKPLEH